MNKMNNIIAIKRMDDDEDAIETVQYHALYALYFLSNINLNKGLLNVYCSSNVSLFQSILPLFIGLLIYLRVFNGSILKFILHCKRVLL